MTYVWQLRNWPKMVWDDRAILTLLGQARLAQGTLLERVRGMGFDLGEGARADILAEEAIKTSAIEGERLNPQAVRSSVARHLGLPAAGLGPSTRSVDGLVEVLLDATQNHAETLTADRLKGWQAALFPTGRSGFHKILVGKWRGAAPMRVVSGPMGRERIHYEAPPGAIVNEEMRRFLSWWNEKSLAMDGLLRAGLAHFYFVIVHPFEDGNGRIARALTDMALAQDEKMTMRYYSLSSRIMEERDAYYQALGTSSNRENLDITEWFLWFLGCYQRALKSSENILAMVLAKADFWKRHAQTGMNERQRKVVNHLLDAGKGGFEGGLTTRKYVGMAKVSRATAFREIADLVQKKILRQNTAGGRSVCYDILWDTECKNQ